jgi:hypothetical protein
MRWRRGSVALAPAALVALPALPWLWDAHVRASWATLGRDQGIFQYVAWAVAGGAKAYRDVRDVNGPLVVLVHRVLLALGGADERVFRTLDLVFTAATAAFAGASLPSLGEARPRPLERAAWAVAAWVVVAAQYLAFGWWDTAQRESFFDWFVLVSFGLALLATGAKRAIARDALLFGAGAASVAPWLGKPTYALVTVAQVAAQIVDEHTASRRRRLGAFGLGGLAGAAIPLGYLAIAGDPASWARITFHDVPAMYRFIWPRTAADILSMPAYSSLVAVAIASSLAVGALVATKRLPRRAIPIAALPPCGLASVLVQAKGFAYHFHPVALGGALALLVLGHAAWTAAVARPGLVLRLAAGAFLAGLGARSAYAFAGAPFPPAPAPEERAALDGEARLAPFVRIDFFPHALRAVASHLASKTRPEDTVQTYGMDPYVLFLAKRRSATPYIYAYDLDADAALAGSWLPEGLHPDEGQRATIRALREAHENDMLARLERAPPAAFVFIGRSPLLVHADALVDFETHCPRSARWVKERYRETLDVEGVRVWLRNDVPSDP